MVDPENLESVDLPRTAIEPDAGETIARIGPYHLLEKIGEGGMGEVWLAEQREPVRRKVALKVIKQGMDTKQVVARFEAERQALAMMDHAVIAKVFDAGATPQGRPYFVMELVRGVPITEYCDRHKLTNRERLELFIRVCEGVQHAHQKAVIHRDLKPSNILVSVRNDRPVPKIIDFGVAKATAQKLTDQTMHTQMGVLDTLTHLDEELEALSDRQAVLVAVLGERLPVNQLHGEVGSSVLGGPTVIDARNARVAH